MPRKALLLALVCIVVLVLVPATAADDSDDHAPACELMDGLEALEAECEDRHHAASASSDDDDDDDGGPRSRCRLPAQVIFWTANDWVLLAQELAARQGECAHYYISIPPTANDKKLLRFLQDDIIRALGPRFRPVAEMTLGTDTGWAQWVAAVPGRTWTDAGIEFRNRMVAAGYDFSRGETWLVNEADRSTRRDELPYTRQAIRDVVRGLALGDGTGPVVPGILELGIQYSHMTMPDLTELKADSKGLLADSAFWADIGPHVAFFAREAYGDARRWGVAGSSLRQRERHLNDYFMHLARLADDGDGETRAARRFLRDRFLPLTNATWPARAPEAIPLSPVCPAVYICGHGWTQMPLEQMLTFVSEEVYAVRRAAGKDDDVGPGGRIGFSWQPTNNFGLPAAPWEAARRAIAARIGSAIRDAYGPDHASAKDACGEPGTTEDFCTGADVPDAFFTDAWAEIADWDDDDDDNDDDGDDDDD
jgi:hypothetical protein